MLSRIEIFERTFTENFAGFAKTCECGETYFDTANDGYGLEEGELEKLQANPKAHALDYAPGLLSFEGKQFVDACSCWHPRATMIMNFLDAHDYKIAEYLSLMKEEKIKEAAASPTVR